MTLDKARNLAQEEANKSKERFVVVYDKLNEDKDDLYTFCEEQAANWLYPKHHSNFFKIIEFMEPKV